MIQTFMYIIKSLKLEITYIIAWNGCVCYCIVLEAHSDWDAYTFQLIQIHKTCTQVIRGIYRLRCMRCFDQFYTHHILKFLPGGITRNICFDVFFILYLPLTCWSGDTIFVNGSVFGYVFFNNLFCDQTSQYIRFPHHETITLRDIFNPDRRMFGCEKGEYLLTKFYAFLALIYRLTIIRIF